MNTILLTGGAGYIGSHTFMTLREAGFEPVILDNFLNSSPVVLERLAHP
jgi:UDP-glucose 4-epimerase